MANKLLFEVDITTGNLKLAQQDMKKLSAQIDGVGAAHSRAGKEADTHYHKQGKGVIGTANSTKSFSKLAQSINGDNNSLVGAYAALAANIFAVTAAFMALKNAAEVQQVIEGLAASGARLGLSYKNAIVDVRNASEGLLTLEQSARSTAQVLSAGFKTDQLVRITKAAKDASFALGRDMTDSMDRLTRGVIKLEPELLDELGIMVRLDEASIAYARSLGKSTSALTSAEKRQGFFNAVLSEAEAKFGGLATGADTSAAALNKLATVFNDLTKTIFNGMNVVLVPFAKLFSSSPIALLGGMLLFASSIKGQLLPVLTDAADRMQAFAEKSSKLSGITASNIITNARGAAAKGQDKAVNDYFIAVQKGGGSLEETRQSQEKLNKAIEDNSAKTSKNAKEKIVAYRMQLDGLKKIEISQLQTAAITNQANAANAASMGNYRAAISFTSAAIQDYAAHVGAANTKTGILGTVSRGASVGMFALGAAAKTAGIAFLTFLPYLGLIVVVLGLLYSGIKMLAGEGYAKLTEATKAYNEVIKTASKSLEHYNKLNNSTASMFTITTEKAVIAGNSITSMATALRELNEAQKNNTGFGKAIDGVKNFFNVMRTEEIKGMVKRNQEAGGSIEYWEMEKNSDLVRSFEKMSKYGTAGGLIEKAFGKKGPKTIEDYRKAVALLENKFKDLSSVIESVREAFKGLDIAAADFIKAATPNTPYDAMTSSLQGATSSMSKYVEEVGKGTQNSEDLIATLSGLGPSISQFLSPGSADTLQTYRDVTTEIQRVKALGDDATKADKASLAIQQEKLPTLQSQGVKLLDNLNTVRAEFEVLQNNSIEQQGQLALAQARLTVVGRSTAITKAESEAKIDAENAVIGLQVSQLKAQANILRSIVLQNEEKQKLIDKEKELIGLGGVIDEQAKLQINNEKILLLSKSDDFFAKGNIEIYEEQNKVLRESIGLKINNARAQAGINNLENQAAALASTMISQAQKDATSALDVANQALRDQSNELLVLDAKLDRLKDISNIDMIINGSSSYMLDMATELLKKQELKRKMLEQESVIRIAQYELEKAKSTTSENIKKYESLIAEEKKAIMPELRESLRIQQEQEYLTAIQAKSQADLKDILKQNLALSLSTLEAESKLVIASKERAQNFVKEMAAKRGVTLSPSKERDMQIDMAKTKLAVAEAEYSLKIQMIEMEYTLLKFKAAEERRRLLETELLMKKRDDYDESDPYALLLRSTIQSYDKLLGNRTEINMPSKEDIAAAAKEGAVAPLPVTSIRSTGPGIYDRAQQAAGSAAAGDLAAAKNALTIALTPEADEFTSFINSVMDSAKELVKVWVPGGPLTANIIASVDAVFPYLEKMKAIFTDLGPEGMVISSLISGMQNIAKAMETVAIATTKTKDAALAYYAAVQTGDAAKIKAAGLDLESAQYAKLTAQLGMAASMVGQLNSILAASSDAKIANIDREIAAEQKRDGKSSESVARIQAMEKKKDSIAKKSFEIQKKLQMAQAVISTAAAITGVLSQFAIYGPFTYPLAAAIGAMGLAQIALIAGTSYQSASSASAAATPSAVSVGKRSDSVNLARNNATPGGELGYLTGAQGTGTSSSNFRPRAYGGYGHAGMIVGEKGPEVFTPSVPGQITPNDKVSGQQVVPVSFHINAIDAEGVEQVLTNQRGHIIGMLREAANANGERFLENVDTAKYARRGGRRL